MLYEQEYSNLIYMGMHTQYEERLVYIVCMCSHI